ncbi:glucose-1-phosphate thymidylyltransferase RfbA [Streptoalloteichus hindustanus]|uniref:Glucose-1-phosphate thymidylyltransferase n=1 Tax=Streptoalloteichus hindustanus TaxID=2017 RepID=A0A1M5HZP8_STRHI|nr:glucose-1-phosphate thymidylyltransferase RfbA [Streptoalloteichus hindustanus]SHG21279.1 glucose-1-phosphate thymidylyltransferase [Streptoalloteichus hindustanus]
MKGVILAGGAGAPLHPVTLAVPRQLLPVGDKPMIYYPLSVLMLAGVRDILVITTPADAPRFRHLLGDGARLGIHLRYAEQPEPRGIAHALVLGARHIATDPVALILGDTVLHGHTLHALLREHTRDLTGCVLFGHPVSDPQRYGIAETDARGRLVAIHEKPARPPGNRAITGLYLYDNQVVEIARELRPSDRGELEITDVNNVYVGRGEATLVDLGRGFAWLDTGSPDTLLQASQYIQTLQQRQGVRVACLEEVALRMGFIDADACHALGREMATSAYGQYVMATAREFGAA